MPLLPPHRHRLDGTEQTTTTRSEARFAASCDTRSNRELDGAGRFAAAAFEHFGGDKAVSMLLDVDYQNFVLFSRATVGCKVVAVGVLGNVFVELPAPPSSSRKRRR